MVIAVRAFGKAENRMARASRCGSFPRHPNLLTTPLGSRAIAISAVFSRRHHSMKTAESLYFSTDSANFPLAFMPG
jgi:hypothetical protein